MLRLKKHQGTTNNKPTITQTENTKGRYIFREKEYVHLRKKRGEATILSSDIAQSISQGNYEILGSNSFLKRNIMEVNLMETLKES
jgi:hypothetical protein